jgi:hypothetical protein
MSAISTKRTRKDARKTSKGGLRIQEVQSSGFKVQGSKFMVQIPAGGLRTLNPEP